MRLQQDPNKFEIYSEVRRTKIFVGTLSYHVDKRKFILEYSRKYLISRSSIELGPELPLTQISHVSKTGVLFPSLEDRIPSRQNPAYPEYCASQGVAVNEKNPIVLLTTIGKRGPSTFVFESVPLEPDLAENLRSFRKKLGITLREMALAFDLNLLTLNKIERGKSQDKNTLRLVEIYSHFPEVALTQVQANARKLHYETADQLQKILTQSAL